VTDPNTTPSDQQPDAAVKALQDRLDSMQSKLSQIELDKVRLEERVKIATEKSAEPEAPVLNRDQLQSAVDAGQITESQRDEELARQLRESLRDELIQELDHKNTVSAQKKELQAEFDAYVAARPDLKVDGSEDLKRVQAEISEMKKRGLDQDLRTEVLAMKMVFGSLDRVKETTRSRRESHKETGGGSDRSTSTKTSDASWEKGLTSRQIDQFRNQAATLYKGEDDPFFLKVTTRARTKNVDRSQAA